MNRSLAVLLTYSLVHVSQACSVGPEPAGSRECSSLLGTSLVRIEPQGERLLHYSEALAQARLRWEREAQEIDAIWVGRHLGYLGRYQEALAWFSERLLDFPESVRLLRHRGHRYLSVRQPAAAILDLSRAWELAAGTPDAIEPDGAPNEMGLPRSTTQTNVLYHLGLGYYLMGDFGAAQETWKTCVELCTNDDMLVASLNWRVHALRRLGRDEEARQALGFVREEMDILENASYHRILLLQQGSVSAASLRRELALDPAQGSPLAAAAAINNASLAYGLGAWYFCNGDQQEALRIWQGIVQGSAWNAFGHLAAEAELAR